MITRKELYDLVWETPLSRLAKKFGLSDVGLRKVCARHNIPTPSIGYWAKLAHGKPIRRPPLPPSEANVVLLVAHTGSELARSVVAAQDAALSRESQFPALIVPSEPPRRLHPIAVATRKALRAAKGDEQGYKQSRDPDCVNVTVGPESIDRAISIVHTFACGAEERGYSIVGHEDGLRIVVDDVPFSWRLYEGKDRKEHQPTKEELRLQAHHDEQRARWPSLYSSSQRKVYRSWDYFPSGRLTLSLTDGTRASWDQDGLVGRWQDRKSKQLEDYLGEAMSALVMFSVAAKHRLAEKAERERRRAEEVEQHRREQEQRECEAQRREFMIERARDYALYQKLVAFADFLERSARGDRTEVVDRFSADLRQFIAEKRHNLGRDSLQEEIVRLQLYAADDVMDEGGLRSQSTQAASESAGET